MKRTIKKAMSTLLAAMMIFGMFSTAYADESNVVTGTCGDNLMWEINRDLDYLTISGNGAMDDYTNTKSPWSDYAIDLKYVVINSGVTTIGKNAFSSLSLLTRVDLPSSLTSIGDYAFCSCGIETVVIPEGVVSIGEYAFSDCDDLFSAALPSTLTDIGKGAFLYCESLAGYSVNENNPNFCSENNILFSKDKTELVYYTAGNKATSYTVPGYVDKIGEYAFGGSRNLESLTISEGVEEIGEGALSGCSFKNIVLPQSIKYIGATGEWSVDAPPMIYYNGTLKDWLYNFEDYGSGGILCYVNSFYINGELLADIVIPEDVDYIRQNAFYGYKGLKSIDFGVRTADNTLVVGEGAFGFCDGLTEISIPEYVWLDFGVFQNCANLSEIKLPEFKSEWTNFGEEFSDTSSFVGTTYIGSYSFFGTAYYNNPDNWEDGVLYIDEYLVAIDDAVETVTVKEETKLILPHAAYSLNGNSSLKKINITDGVEAIGERAFQDCQELLEVDIADTVRYIADMAFYGCSKLKKVELPEAMFDYPVRPIYNYSSNKAMPTIEYHCFAECTSLEEITIPGKELNVMGGAFEGCSSLKTVYFEGTKEDWDNIRYMDNKKDELPEEIGVYGNDYFENATVIFENGAVISVPGTTKPSEEPTTQPEEPTTKPTEPSTTKPAVEEEIIKKPSTSTVKYGETLILHANFTNIPEGTKIEWSVEGEGVTIKPSEDGKTCAVTSTVTGDVTVTAKYVDANGIEHVSEQEIESNASIWQKIVSFFKNLFGISRIIEQAIKF